jgi:hypothetical protein
MNLFDYILIGLMIAGIIAALCTIITNGKKKGSIGCGSCTGCGSFNDCSGSVLLNKENIKK